MMDLDKLSRENFPPFDCQTIFLDRFRVLNVHSDDPFYYLSPHPSYFICFVYEATKCYGDDQDQFPSDGHFAAVSNGICDNGAACGRRYRMRCISGPRRPCRNRSVVEVVDFCRYNPCRATMALPFKAFAAISIPRYGVRINVEYAQI
ncbi:hypothetical protein ACB092_01G121900 [Castanea dentata]